VEGLRPAASRSGWGHAIGLGTRLQSRLATDFGAANSPHSLIALPNKIGSLETGVPMANRLDRMRRNPTADWTISDVEAVSREYGLRCSAPTGGGSHYKVSHPSQRDILTIPSRRPVKPVYIRKLVRFIDQVIGV
jgi:hypothetical protein